LTKRMRRCLNRLGRLFGILLILCVVFPASAHAYVDPGTGSYFLQFLIAGLLGLLYSIKIYWRKIKETVIDPLARRLKRRT
jgi:hypothetical protein